MEMVKLLEFYLCNNAISMNLLSMFTNNSNALNQIYNTACSKQISLLELVSELELILIKNRK